LHINPSRLKFGDEKQLKLKGLAQTELATWPWLVGRSDPQTKKWGRYYVW